MTSNLQQINNSFLVSIEPLQCALHHHPSSKVIFSSSMIKWLKWEINHIQLCQHYLHVINAAVELCHDLIDLIFFPNFTPKSWTVLFKSGRVNSSQLKICLQMCKILKSKPYCSVNVWMTDWWSMINDWDEWICKNEIVLCLESFKWNMNADADPVVLL